MAGACLGVVSILTRKLSDISFSVALFYAGVVAVLLTSAIICLDSKIRGTPILTFSYSFSQYMFVLIAIICNFSSLSTCTIAYQNDNPAYLGIINYQQLVYAFIADIFVFHVPVQGLLQISAICILVAMNLVLIFSRLKNK